MLGILAKLYHNTGASYAAPTWSSIDLISDVKIGAKWDKADASTRSSRVKIYGKPMLDIEITGKIRCDLTDAGFLAFYNGYLLDQVLDLMILNAASTVNGARGYRADFLVLGSDEDQALSVVEFEDFTMAPGLSTNLPQSVLVTTGAPVFTPITG
jgi:hypothetical protein